MSNLGTTLTKKIRETVARVVALGLVVATLVVLVVGVRHWRGDGPRASLAGAELIEFAPPEPLAGGEAYVRTEVLPSGDLMVTQWIESSQLLFGVALIPPRVAGTEGVTAEKVRVVAGGRIASGKEQIRPGEAQRYSFLGATSVQIRYLLTGAVELSDSAPGRALARLTALDVSYQPASSRVTRTVIAHEVLSLACSSAAMSTGSGPCGAPRSTGEWTVELDGPRAGDRVIAALTIR